MILAVPDTDTNCAVSWRSKPGSFVSLMSLYESNYIRLGWLIPNLRDLEGASISNVDNDLPLHVRVDERSPYTTTLTLTYLFEDADGARVADPDLQIRVYHDARLAEVHGWADAHAHSALRSWRTRAERELDQRWARNVMLNKWLEYCAERGHRFSPATRVL